MKTTPPFSKHKKIIAKLFYNLFILPFFVTKDRIPNLVPRGTVFDYIENTKQNMNRKQSLSLLLFMLLIWHVGTLSAKAKGSIPIDAKPIFTPIVSEISNATSFKGGKFCVDVSVADFNTISMFQYSIGWGDTKLKYESVNTLAPSSDLSLMIGETFTSVGILTVIGKAIDPQGMTFPDETVLFQICFEAIGEIGDCTPVAFTGFPLGIEVTAVETGPVDIGMSSNNGDVCIKSELLIHDSQIFDINCNNIGAGAIQLAVNGATPPYQYQWKNANGFTGNTKNIFGLEPGEYFVTINDSSEPPIIIDSMFTVLGDLEPPVLTMNGSNILNCNNPILPLPVELENGGDSPIIQWTTEEGHFTNGQNTLIPNVDQIGTYQLIVINSENTCSDTLTLAIEEDFTKPNVIANFDGFLNCEVTEIEISAENSSSGPEYIYDWNSVNGHIISTSNEKVIKVDEPGFYDLVILNTLNGCVDSTKVEILENSIQPIIDAGVAMELNCVINEVELMGIVNSSPDDLVYNWLTSEGNIVSGNNTLTPIVNNAGPYQLVAIDTINFCSDSINVVVGIDTIPPFINIVLSEHLSCVQPSVSLDASDSNTGVNLIYEWSKDGVVWEGVTAPLLEVEEIGNYQLSIKNSSNGCQDSFSIEVIEDNSALAIDFDLLQIACDDFASIQANLPQGTTGQWSSLGNAIVLNENDEETEVEGLIEGNNLLVWTLSTPTCLAYDQDTLIIRRETLPIAQDDYFELAPLAISEELSLIANDGITVTDNWTLELLSLPAFGQIEKVSPGGIQFLNPNRDNGQLNFSYQLCNSLCVDLCDEAEVTIKIDEILLLDTTVEIPSGITPNGDGRNETFIISFLEEDTEAYSSNELVVFNRWGEVVYRAKPYQNDWNGTTNSGEKLPEGTYYYVLRLSLIRGEIYQGEITILR